VSGRVTYRGKPLSSGYVIMVGRNNQLATGEISEDGRYTVDGVVAGSIRIAVSSPKPLGVSLPSRALAQRGMSGAPKMPAATSRVRKAWFPIPGYYGDPDDSGLTVKVPKGESQHDIALD
jgi:hypothetical protein